MLKNDGGPFRDGRTGILRKRNAFGLLAGTVMAICFLAIAALSELRGPPLKSFLPLFFAAAAAYGATVALLNSASPSLRLIWIFAALFRLTLLFNSPPTLSDDVYRYMWDGRLVNEGVSPYAHHVDSPSLDRFDSARRALVNNSWMASPYLPASQALFATVYGLAPNNPLAFQIVALALDLLTGWLVAALLWELGLRQERVLIYLWNPLVVVEFAHGAHIDAQMLCLMMVGLWVMAVEGRRTDDDRRTTTDERRQTDDGGRTTADGGHDSHVLQQRLMLLVREYGSPVALAAATLTKGIPALLVPVVAWRWGWRRTLLYAGIVAGVLLPFGLGDGWGLIGPRDGEGLFGALRIYGARWNYNGGLYHWLEVAVSGYRTPGAVPPEIVGEGPIRAAKLVMAVLLGLALSAIAWKAKQCKEDVALMRLTTLPLAAYLLLTTTVHPWYVTAIVPLLPCWQSEGGRSKEDRFVWAWLYLSVAVALSYLTYLDPSNLREYDWVRLAEYVPFYALLIWSVLPANDDADGLVGD
jgi:hypothetical protein